MIKSRSYVNGGYMHEDKSFRMADGMIENGAVRWF